MIQKEDIEKLARLARLEIAPAEASSLVGDIESILSYISQIEQEEAGVKSQDKQALRNVMREDGEPHPAGAYTKDILAEAPKTEDGYLSVKPILSRDA